jgi:HEPN domain-containing protein
MKNPEEIKKLAYERLEEAQILCDAGKYNGAFYLAGYSIELMLKAKICENWGVPKLFDEQYKIHGISKIRDTIKIHDIAVLLIFSGLKTKFEIAKSTNISLALANALLFESSGRCQWSEQVRYQSNSKDAREVQNLLELLEDDNDNRGLLQWINNN